ncbi:hypothetical protein BJV78DRAFT_1158555 [Lactifluus subvellereus]|nr:hypothetical protein BJV78DRAFT_1158555 [Lactifluus subvellereus]
MTCGQHFNIEHEFIAHQLYLLHERRVTLAFVIQQIQLRIQQRHNLEPSTSYVPLDPVFATLPEQYRPPFEALANPSGTIPKSQIPNTALGKKRAIFAKKGTKLAGNNFAHWDGYYALYDG